MSVIGEYIERCDVEIKAGNQSKQAELISEICSVFVKEIRETGLRVGAYNEHTLIKLRHLRGWLANLQERRLYDLEMQRAGSTNANISATSESVSSSDAIASTCITIDQAVEIISEIDEEGLSDGDKEEIAALLAQAKGIAKKNPKKFAELISKALAKAGDCAKAVQAVVQCAATIAGIISG